jgi:hypothetical protein
MWNGWGWRGDAALQSVDQATSRIPMAMRFLEVWLSRYKRDETLDLATLQLASALFLSLKDVLITEND